MVQGVDVILLLFSIFDQRVLETLHLGPSGKHMT